MVFSHGRHGRPSKTCASCGPCGLQSPFWACPESASPWTRTLGGGWPQEGVWRLVATELLSGLERMS